MSDTPETDSQSIEVGWNHMMVDTSFAEKLERERDEARGKWAIASEALRLIAEEGGQTGGNRTIIADGAWCAAHAQRILDSLK